MLGTATLSSGWSVQATFSTSALALGTHPITAVYNGDSNFTGSTSSALSQNVTSSTAYVWTGADGSDPNDWNDPGDWLVNGAPATSAPTSSSDVLFSGVQGTDTNCSTPDDAAVAVNSLTIDSSYTGTLTANNELDVGSGGFNMAGGNIAQPNGDGSTISVTDADVVLAGGVLNTCSTASTFYVAAPGKTEFIIGNGDSTTGDNEVVDGGTASFGITNGTYSFKDGAGITVESGGNSTWTAPQATSAKSGPGSTIKSTGSEADFDKTTTSGNSAVSCALPIVNNGGSLKVDKGTLDLTGAYRAAALPCTKTAGGPC